MKKSIIAIAIILTVVAITVHFINLPRPGDVNNDREITSLDYILIKNHISGKEKLSLSEEKRADVNRDGQINELDYKEVEKIIMEK